MNAGASLRAQAGVFWDRLAGREKLLVAAAVALVVIALAWWIAIAPALRTLRGAAQQHALLDAQLQQMGSMAQQAQALQSQPRVGYDQALRALEATVKQRLGSAAQLNVVGDRATVRLKGVGADTLAQWLAQCRINARALPAEARLTRVAVPGQPGPAWDGTVVLSLPAR